MTGMQWAAGLSVSGVPDNPYPADIINLSLGGTGTCLSDYQAVINTLNAMGVLMVASAGNSNGAVESPANCQGVLAVAGVRNVGTKVGYSSFGAEVAVSAPAGNCVNSSGACLRSIDTTTNTGLTTPADNTYTNEINPNLGTSFSAPIVSGIAALMRAVNGNLAPAQLIARIEASASPFPANSAGLPVCPATDSASGQCSCVAGQCGAGLANAYHAVQAAQDPIAAIAVPSNLTVGSATFDGSGSIAACNQNIASYAWSATGGVVLVSGASGPAVQVTWNGAPGTLQLTVTDAAGYSDTALVEFTATGATTSAPTEAGTSAAACPAPITFAAEPPTVVPLFSPASIASGATAILTLTLINHNPFALTQSTFTQSVPANLSLAPAPALATTCGGAHYSLTSTDGAVTLSNANIPANSSCLVTFTVTSASAGSYTAQVPAQALMTAPAGGNSAAATATLTVTAPAAGGGGGSLTGFDVLVSAVLLLWGRARDHARA
jgi:serine protease